MSEREPSSTLFIAAAIVVAMGVVSLSGLAGWWLGGRTDPPGHDTGLGQIALDEDSNDGLFDGTTVSPPLFLHVNTLPGADLTAVSEQARLAANAGVHQYVVSVLPMWSGVDTNADAVLAPFRAVLEGDPAARFFVSLSLNPPSDWLERHPEAAMDLDGVGNSLPSVSSQTWLDGAIEAFDTLHTAIRRERYRVMGYIPGALKEDRWHLTGERDASLAHQRAFREWLVNRYETDEALQAAWGDPAITLDMARIPVQPDTENTSAVFFRLPDEQEHVDFYAFHAQSTIRAIRQITEHIRRRAGAAAKIVVPYGYSFEYGASGAGHLALAEILDSDIDGLVSPVSYVDRGVGGAGGFMGPVHSARVRGKQWYLIDDTRTGISRDTSTGEATRVPGIRSEDVINVHKRNFAAVLASELGLFWSDADGNGALLDAELWSRFRAMRRAYAQFWTRLRQTESLAGPEGLHLDSRVTLCVAIDETSRFYQRCDSLLNERLLLQARDSALLAGVPVRFCLLDDVLEGRAMPAAVYLFPNAFHLTQQQRTRIHEVLRRDEATAIWMYAPGYFDENGPSVENIARTTGFRVRPLDEGTLAGSVGVLPAHLIREGDPMGESIEWGPLFDVNAENDPGATVLANYRATEQPSMVIRFFDDWGSVYLADPVITPNLLRQLLMIVEEHIYVSSPADIVPDVTHFGPNFVAIHGRSELERERVIEFEAFYDIQDVLDEDIGWPQRQTLGLPLRFGETRLLALTPTEFGDE